MKTIERLRGLIARVKESPKAFTAKEMDDWSAADAEVYAVLPAMLAVVEAQAAEIAAWREFQEEAESRSWSKAWPVHADWIADAQNATDAAGALKGVE